MDLLNDSKKVCINMPFSSTSITISCNRDIATYYKQIHDSYLSTRSKPSMAHREWMALISFLNKNRKKQCKTLYLYYPFTIQKSEKPDFKIIGRIKTISIEIVRVTAKNLEALITLAYKCNKARWESDARLYNNDVKMTRMELRKLIYKPGEPLSGSGILGNFQEKKWAELCYQAVAAKSNKKYKMNVLLLDDQHVQSCHEESVFVGINYLKEMITEHPIQISNIDCIISENQSGIILLFERHLWKYEYRKDPSR